MAQVLEFKLPDLGEGLTEAEIVRWLVQVGDVVAIDQPVVEVETAKAMVEVPCPYGGVVTARFGEEGTELPVGAPLLTVAVGAPASGVNADEGSGNVLVGYGTGAPQARRRRVRPGEPIRPVTPAAPHGAAHHRRNVGRSRAPGRTRAGHFPARPPPRPRERPGPAEVERHGPRGPDPAVGRGARAAGGHGPGSGAAGRDRAAGRSARRAARARRGPSATRVPLRGVRGAVADKLSRSRMRDSRRDLLGGRRRDGADERAYGAERGRMA